MTRSRGVFRGSLLLLCAAGACSGDDASDGPRFEKVTLDGAVQKGPFVLGSTINVSPVDAAGDPTGEVFSTQTTTDLGEFNLVFSYQGGVSIEGVGFYYNEITGTLSTAQLTLRAFHDISQGGAQRAYVNILTHLAYGRVKKLLEGGTNLISAIQEAETSLISALGIGAVSAVGKPAIDMNILGGDDDANAYLFAVSAVLAQAAMDTATGPIDASLQELINTIALDFSDDGALTPTRQQLLEEAERNLMPTLVAMMLRKRLDDLGSSATLPELNRVLDSDGDGIANATDTCPLASNPTQEVPAGTLCRYELSLTPMVATTEGGVKTLFGNFDGDGKADLLFVAGPEAWLAVGDGNGGFAAPIAHTTTLPAGRAGEAGPGEVDAAGDFNGDGRLDLLVRSLDPLGVSYLPQDPSGNFGSAVDLWPTGLPASIGACYLQPPGNWAMVAELSGDAKDDLVFESGGCAVAMTVGTAGTLENPQLLAEYYAAVAVKMADVDAANGTDVLLIVDNSGARDLVVHLNDGAGTLSAATPIAVAAETASLLTGHFDTDAHLDAVLSVQAGSTGQDLKIYTGDGAGNFTSGQNLTAATAGTVADIDGDGLDELVIPDVFANGSGTLSQIGEIDLSSTGISPNLGNVLERDAGDCLVGTYGFAAASYEIGAAVLCFP